MAAEHKLSASQHAFDPSSLHSLLVPVAPDQDYYRDDELFEQDSDADRNPSHRRKNRRALNRSAPPTTLDQIKHTGQHLLDAITGQVAMGGGKHIPRPQSVYPALAARPVGQWISSIYIERIAQFTSNGQWEKSNLLAMMYEGVARSPSNVNISVWSAPGLSRPSFETAVGGNYRDVEIGEYFGPAWSTHWFKLRLTVPKELREKKHLEFHWDANNEGLLYSDDGMPLQGLTGNNERIEWILPDSFRDGKEHTVYVEMACNGMFGCAPGDDVIAPPDPEKQFQLTKADIVAVNLEARRLFVDIVVIGDAARELPRDSSEQHRAVKIATRVIDAFKLGDKDSIAKCREIAQDFLGPLIDSHTVYSPEKNPYALKIYPEPSPQVFAVGHCHIDSCWLWPWAETKRKVARSWTNQCNLMERYPELNFVCSQAQQYKWLEQGYPAVFDRVRKHVAGGQFHPVGGSWVEHDTNMPGGESLVRQFLYGQRFFESRFGLRCHTFWLPDTFGYSAQLPQLCRLAGMHRFLTQKLSWNNINKFPHTTFNWVSLDGSQVLCHMPPSETYTADANLNDVKRSITQHKSLDNDDTSLLIFGKGDGGGGPTWPMLERLRRCRGMSDRIGMLPRVHTGNSADHFFDSLEAKADMFPTWYGELYFELHRGTYTTQANNKYNNRKSESLLRTVELLATMATLREPCSYRYPKDKIDEMWESVLLCQFHDCLPGSSIEMCYDDSDQEYAKVFKNGSKILTDVWKVFGVSAEKYAEKSEKNKPGRILEETLAVNTLPWHREEVVEVSDDQIGIACGSGPLIRVRPFEAVAAATEGKRPVTIRELRPGVFIMRNAQLQVTIEDGCVSSLYDIANDRECIEKGAKANQYTLFDDKPLYWQAWDVEVYHLDTREVLPSTETRILENKGHRVSVVMNTKISETSSIRTVISLGAALEGQQSRVDVQAEVEWKESMKFLKVEFPVEVRNTEASYETAFGVVRRPTHYNTSWDMAKFEVCCHRYADLSEHNYGVSILNDSKYGFATCGNTMRLSLLRAPKAPDAHADMGTHTIRWAMLPHAGSLGATTVRAAFAFNNPLTTVSAPRAKVDELSSHHPVVLIGDESIVLDTIKRGEDDEDVSRGELPKRKGRSVVLRVYDSLGCRSKAEVRTRWDVKRVCKTNLLEDEVEQIRLLEHTDPDNEYRAFRVQLRPFEVATYRLEL